jgi:prepilin-type processing-associated H-X9-DG protein
VKNRFHHDYSDPTIIYGAAIDYAAIKGVDASLGTAGLADVHTAANSRAGMMELIPGNPPRLRGLNDCLDGTSNTIALAECAGRPGLWRKGKQVLFSEFDPGRATADDTGGDIPGGAWAEPQNSFFIHGSSMDGTIRPGPCGVNCANSYAIGPGGTPTSGTRSYTDGEIYGFHPGGANVTMGDGSVRFISQGISIRTLARVATAAGGEVVNAADL